MARFSREADGRALGMKCYCGFVCETERQLKEHIVSTHGARDGDWKGWVSN